MTGEQNSAQFMESQTTWDNEKSLEVDVLRLDKYFSQDTFCWRLMDLNLISEPSHAPHPPSPGERRFEFRWVKEMRKGPNSKLNRVWIWVWRRLREFKGYSCDVSDHKNYDTEMFSKWNLIKLKFYLKLKLALTATLKHMRPSFKTSKHCGSSFPNSMLFSYAWTPCIREYFLTPSFIPFFVIFTQRAFWCLWLAYRQCPSIEPQSSSRNLYCKSEVLSLYSAIDADSRHNGPASIILGRMFLVFLLLSFLFFPPIFILFRFLSLHSFSHLPLLLLPSFFPFLSFFFCRSFTSFFLFPLFLYIYLLLY